METFTAEEARRLAPFVTNLDQPVFCLRNLPAAISAGAFARYSRSPKSLRRLLLDELLPNDTAVPDHGEVDDAEARALTERVIAAYGDDSVGQLAAVSVAFEGVSNILTKVIEWGRLGSYLEQSTRYIDFSDRPGGRYRYHVPAELTDHPQLRRRFIETMDGLFGSYIDLMGPMEAFCDAHTPPAGPGASAGRSRAVKARALDAVRGLLPAATTSNVGVFASGQALESLLVRLLSHPLAEARQLGALALAEARIVIPSFLTRVDRPDRGVATAAYRRECLVSSRDLVRDLVAGQPASPAGAPPLVRLVEHDPAGEDRILRQIVTGVSDLDHSGAAALVADLSTTRRRDLIEAYVGRRSDRRHRPGRAFEATDYTFEIVCDYGAYRDLQRHRLLMLQAQPLGAGLGVVVPDDIEAAGFAPRWREAHGTSHDLWRDLSQVVPEVAPYAVSMSHRIRFTIQMNAREAMHLIELRSQPQGHEAYRRVAIRMREQIRSVAGHSLVAGAMEFTDERIRTDGRLDAETRSTRRV
ncbi:FAD-dependent thymidylate synthase [Miltoncostaea oceani]|uniref:FAD-dependent thymidylate synthase n=1 Tax=Miltoncostaea oceani TaxID=2843216 RepID=UPI001C3C2642|nr:FAD-dependent thymidylate synthase [Miltoncostaea oceani]